jgi:aminoglycoside 6'-N-acetyltransferase I
MQVRLAAAADVEAIASMRAQLWPDASIAEHRAEALAIIEGGFATTLPLVIFVAHEGEAPIGFVEVGLRSHADGCDPARACGYLEGWFVAAAQRRRGVGRLLVDRAEQWAREQGCTELASDTWIDNEGSQHAHAALGFEVVDRCVHYKKPIAQPGGDIPHV